MNRVDGKRGDPIKRRRRVWIRCLLIEKGSLADLYADVSSEPFVFGRTVLVCRPAGGVGRYVPECIQRC